MIIQRAWVTNHSVRGAADRVVPVGLDAHQALKTCSREGRAERDRTGDADHHAIAKCRARSSERAARSSRPFVVALIN